MRTDDVAPKVQKSGVSRKKMIPENVTESGNADANMTVKKRNLSKIPENGPIKQTEESTEMTDDPKNRKANDELRNELRVKRR